MNRDYEEELERQVDHALKRLPDLEAPPALVSRVMTTIARRRARPWYRVPWPQWPVVHRAVSLALMLASFGGACWTAWLVMQSPAGAALAGRLDAILSNLSALWCVAGVLFNTLLLTVRQLGTPVLVACVAVALASYLACVGIGTVLVRFALAQKKSITYENRTH